MSATISTSIMLWIAVAGEQPLCTANVDGDKAYHRGAAYRNLSCFEYDFVTGHLTRPPSDTGMDWPLLCWLMDPCSK